jgi:thymidylate synthase (FAD)
MPAPENLKWLKYPVLNDGFICLVDVMGDDQRIVNAARASYGKDERALHQTIQEEVSFSKGNFSELEITPEKVDKTQQEITKKDRGLIRRLMDDGHTSPFEKVKFEFFVRVPMDCWRQWIRHRTADVNEYSTRYKEAIDSQQTTLPGEWRLQATDNKQGSSGFLEEWPDDWIVQKTEHNYTVTTPNGERIVSSWTGKITPGEYLTNNENEFHAASDWNYQLRLALGVAREQARKDLPLSTYTEAYWGCSLHNIFNFLRLRMDSHAQLEIRLYANAMFEIIKQICPIACEAFEDYILHAKKFSRMEMELLTKIVRDYQDTYEGTQMDLNSWSKPSNMTDNEWKNFLNKLL